MLKKGTHGDSALRVPPKTKHVNPVGKRVKQDPRVCPLKGVWFAMKKGGKRPSTEKGTVLQRIKKNAAVGKNTSQKRAGWIYREEGDVGDIEKIIPRQGLRGMQFRQGRRGVLLVGKVWQPKENLRKRGGNPAAKGGKGKGNIEETHQTVRNEFSGR